MCGCAKGVGVGVDNGENLAIGSVLLTLRSRTGPVSWPPDRPTLSIAGQGDEIRNQNFRICRTQNNRLGVGWGVELTLSCILLRV